MQAMSVQDNFIQNITYKNDKDIICIFLLTGARAIIPPAFGTGRISLRFYLVD